MNSETEQTLTDEFKNSLVLTPLQRNMLPKIKERFPVAPEVLIFALLTTRQRSIASLASTLRVPYWPYKQSQGRPRSDDIVEAALVKLFAGNNNLQELDTALRTKILIAAQNCIKDRLKPRISALARTADEIFESYPQTPQPLAEAITRAGGFTALAREIADTHQIPRPTILGTINQLQKGTKRSSGEKIPRA